MNCLVVFVIKRANQTSVVLSVISGGICVYRSGNPLQLNEDLYTEFQQYWYQHIILEKITSTNDEERKFMVKTLNIQSITKTKL